MTAVLLAGARTPIGKMSGALGSFTSVQLGGIAIEAALGRAGVEPDQVDYVFMGQVLLAGTGQLTARQAAVNAGIPLSTPACTINKVCLSGLYTIHLARQMIDNGEADIVVAGGMESMTNAPYLLARGRDGYRYGNDTLFDAIIRDGLACALQSELMGESTERFAASASISREVQDEIAAASNDRAARATKDGILADEIVPVEIPQRRGEAIVVSEDEGIRPGTTAESLSKLRPAFSASGNITAGNASQISDGASAVVVTSLETAERLGVEPLAELGAYGQVAGPDTSLLHQPSNAIRSALGRCDMSLGDIDLFEINEAFAAVAAASVDDLGVGHDVVNVNGGAIALGHPVGMSGNRLALTLALELKRRGGGIGAAALCGGGGQGDAMLIRTI